jgi:hypothetical protein
MCQICEEEALYRAYLEAQRKKAASKQEPAQPNPTQPSDNPSRHADSHTKTPGAPRPSEP